MICWRSRACRSSFGVTTAALEKDARKRMAGPHGAPPRTPRSQQCQPLGPHAYIGTLPPCDFAARPGSRSRTLGFPGSQEGGVSLGFLF